MTTAANMYRAENPAQRWASAGAAKVTLRPYQERAVDEIVRKIKSGVRRILVIAPTGAGKTVIFSRILCGAAEKGNPSLVVAHRGELLEQTWGKVEDAGVPPEFLGMIWAQDKRANPRALVQVASLQTLINRARPPAKLVIVDEAHRAMGASYQRLISDYPDSIHLGFTATPWRLDRKGLGQFYEAVVIVATVPELIRDGFLCRPRVFSHPLKPDLAGVATVAGDYAERELEQVMCKNTLLNSLVEHWLQHAGGVPTLAFGVGVEHSSRIAETFRKAGIAAEHVDGDTPRTERAAALARLRSGATKVLSNCGLFVEGFDAPGVKCVILARPTQSRALYFQAVGRGMRPVAGAGNAQTTLVLDHAGCALKHGLPDDPQDYSLDTSMPPVRVKSCPMCFAVVESGSLACSECGYAFEATPEPRVEETEETPDATKLEELLSAEEEKRAKLAAEIEKKTRDKVRREIQWLALSSDEARAWEKGATNKLLAKRFGSRTVMDSSQLAAVLEFLRCGFREAYPIPPPTPPRPARLLRNADALAADSDEIVEFDL